VLFCEAHCTIVVVVAFCVKKVVAWC